MIVYNAKIGSEKSKLTLEKSFKERLLNMDNPPIYIFPFSLFSKSFYKDKAVFIGKVSDGAFDLETRSKLIATRARLPISLKGTIKNNEIEIKYQIPTFAILIILACILVDLLFVSKTNNLDNVFYLTALVLVFRYVFLILRIQNIFKKVSKIDTVSIFRHR